MAATKISNFPASSIPPPDSYDFVMQDPVGVVGSANYKINYGNLKLGFVPAARAIAVVAPISGGGDLSANRTVTTLMNTARLIGRNTAGAGVMEEITLGTNLAFAGTVLNATAGSGSFATIPITVTITAPAIWTQTTVVDVTITPASRITLFPGMTTELDMNDWIEGEIAYKAVPGTGNFVVEMYATDKSVLFGDYKFQYTVG